MRRARLQRSRAGGGEAPLWPPARRLQNAVAMRPFRFRAAGAVVLMIGSACQRGHGANDAVARGAVAISNLGCGACHQIDGIPAADGRLGPPLTGVASRALIAGALPNSAANLSRWIANPQAIQPGVAMPAFGGAGEQTVRDIVAYLETLR